MDNHELTLLESVVQITTARSIRSLEKKLAEIIYDLIDCETVVLIRLPESNKIEVLEIAVSLPQDSYLDKYEFNDNGYGDPRIKPKNDIIDCISSREVYLDNNENPEHIIIPAVTKNNVTNLLDIYGYKQISTSIKALETLIELYSNFMSVLDDNERDTLTGLFNRKAYDEKLISMLSENDLKKKNTDINKNERRAKEKSQHYWMGILDIDHFKKINDEFGHLYGDEILLLFSNLMKKVFRINDLLFRYGGEEFVVVIRPSEESDVLSVFERFRSELEAYAFPRVGKVTVSIGIVKIELPDHPTTIFMKADKALYYAKENGRNRVCDYNQLVRDGVLVEKGIESDVELF